MDVNKVFLTLKELGHINSRRDELRDFCKLNVDQITQHLPRRIINSDGADILDCLFNGLPDSSDTLLQKKVKIIDQVLKTMRKESTSLTHCGDVISRLCLELQRMPSADLVRWCNDSIQSIIEDSDVNMIWRDILPECLGGLSSYDTVKHCGTDMSIAEYRGQCVHTLCQCQWKEKQLVQLVAMFKDMQMNKNDHKQVVNKICSYIIDIPPETLPPLVHQLLKLCKLYNLEVILAHLSHYFNVRLYSKLEPPPQDSESTTMDIDDIVNHSVAELGSCAWTCVYHVSCGAAQRVRRALRQWPRTQLLRAPFLVQLALALSDKGSDFKTVCLDVIRMAIEQRALDELRSKESAWSKAVLPPDVDVASLLKVLTTESANHRQLTVLGLINLAFALLAVSRTKPVAPTCWSHGKLILVRLCKSQPETAPHVLSLLADKLAGDGALRQYSDTLYILCKLTPVSIERAKELTIILETVQPTAAHCPALDAVSPLLQFSARTRDNLVMLCRKRLYSRDSSHRCLALSGFLSVLRSMRISRTLTSSQPEFSANSYLTQLTLDVHATHQGTAVTSRARNEAVCMEVVSILRRCLVQDAAVKELLYSKIYECTKEKPAIHESILEIFYEHLDKFLPEEDGDASPLLFSKCIQMTQISATLTEPIAHLLYSVAQYLQALPEEEDLEDILASQSQSQSDSSSYLKSKLNIIMEKLCSSDALGRIDTEDVGLADLTPESKAKTLKVQQMLQCHETLVAHKIMQWNQSSSDIATTVYKLYNSYNQLLEQTKAPPKISKKSSKSTLNETKETVKSQRSQKSQKGKGKVPTKVSNLVKDRAGPFKTLPCLWDLKFCGRILELLYAEEVPWSSVAQRNQLRARRDFHHWTLRCVLSALNDEPLDKRHVASYVPHIAALMYNRCICRFQDMSDFDEQTALSCAEVFKVCLTLLFSVNYSLKHETFLSVITGLSESSASAHISSILDSLHASLTQLEADITEDVDAQAKKMVVLLGSIASLLFEVPVACCPAYNAVVIKFEEYLSSARQDAGLVPAVLAGELRAQQETMLLPRLLTRLAGSLGRIDEEDTSAGGDDDTTSFRWIDARNGQTVLSQVCDHLALRFKCIEHLQARAKDLTSAMSNAAHGNQARIEKELTELYKSIILQLCSCSTWTGSACKLRCAVGTTSDRVLSAAARLHAALAAACAALPAPLARPLRFERLVKLSGKKLSSVIDNLITYLEASQRQQTASKVLRDTKLIPRLVLASEQYTKSVMLLANKTKVNYEQYMSLGTARDFRIKAPVLQEVLNARENQQDETSDNEINDAETEVLSRHEPQSDDDKDSDEENTRRKKRRVS